MKFQFIPKSGKPVVTENSRYIIKLAGGSSLINELKDWIFENTSNGDYFEGESFEIIRL